MNGITQLIVALTGFLVAVDTTLSLVSKRQGNRVETTAKATNHLVNQQTTNADNYTLALQRQLIAHGVPVPQDQANPGVVPPGTPPVV